MVDLEARLEGHLLEISIAERVTQILGDRMHDQPRLEPSPLEIILRLALQLLGYGIQNHGQAPLHRERNFNRCDQQLEHFQEKCVAVFRPEMRKNKELERFNVSVKQ